MRTLMALFPVSVIYLPAAIWFARDALVSRLNPWVWAVWGSLSVAAPAVLLFMLTRLLAMGGLFLPKVEQPWGEVIGLSIVAVGWLTAYVIHKRVLKPKRVAVIGTSLNYVGGWLGTFIFMLFLAASLHLAIYANNTYKILEQLCPGEQTGGSLFRCAIASTPVAVETGLMVVSVAGLLLAAIALIRKTASAIPIAGFVLLCFFAVGFLESLDRHIEEVITDNPRTLVRNRQQDDVHTSQWSVSVVWLGYLIRSRRVREVYGRNFWRSNESLASGMPT